MCATLRLRGIGVPTRRRVSDPRRIGRSQNRLGTVYQRDTPRTAVEMTCTRQVAERPGCLCVLRFLPTARPRLRWSVCQPRQLRRGRRTLCR